MPRADILVVGQGLAGTALGWALEVAGLSFEIVDAGHASAASAIAAGIINPITGRRLVKTWRAEAVVWHAIESFRAMEQSYDGRFCRTVRIRRLFADDRERETFLAKHRIGEYGPFVRDLDDTGFWIEGAARIDGNAVLAAARSHWARAGRLSERTVSPAEALGDYAVVIDCRGLAATQDPVFATVPWEYSKGEMLLVRTDGMNPDVVLNRRRWIVAIDGWHAWVGSTHEPGVRDAEPTERGRAILEATARELLPAMFMVENHVAGVRVTVRDKLPVVGVHPYEPRLGIVNALGAKGAMFAPWLARAWAAHLTRGEPFDPALDVARFEG